MTTEELLRENIEEGGDFGELSKDILVLMKSFERKRINREEYRTLLNETQINVESRLDDTVLVEELRQIIQTLLEQL